MKHALFAFNKPVPVDADAKEGLLVRALYRTMKEDNFTEAYQMVVGDSVQGEGAGQ